MVVHLRIAEWCNDGHDDRLWATTATIAKFCNCSTDTVTRALAKMVEDGYLEVLAVGGGRGKATEYRMLRPIHPQDAGVSDDPQTPASRRQTPASARLNTRKRAIAPITNRSEQKGTQVLAPNGADRATDDPLVKRARDLAMLAFEQTPTPITKFPAVMARVEEALRAGYSVQAIEGVIRAGDVVWTQAALTLALGRSRPTRDPVHRGGDTRRDLAVAREAFDREQNQPRRITQ
jgi:hypothetical protein